MRIWGKSKESPSAAIVLLLLLAGHRATADSPAHAALCEMKPREASEANPCSTWLEANPAPTGQAGRIVRAGGRFFVLGDRLLSSHDGILWNTADLPDFAYDLISSGEELIACGVHHVWTSCDGISWNPLEAAAAGPYVAAASNGVTTIVATQAGLLLARTTPSDTFDVVRTSSGRLANRLYWGGDRFVVPGWFEPNQTPALLVSLDGWSWSLHPVPAAVDPLVWTGERWVAQGDPGFVATSRNAIDWELVPTAPDVVMMAIGWNGRSLLGTGYVGVKIWSFRSSDGLTWTPAGGPFAAPAPRELVGSGSTWVAHERYIDPSTLKTSFLWGSRDDGASWTLGASVDDPALEGITSGAGIFLAVGRRNLFRSFDGVTWDPVGEGFASPNLVFNFSGVASSGSTFVAAANEAGSWARMSRVSMLLESSNGIGWTETRRGIGEVLTGAASRGNQLLVSGVDTDGINPIMGTFMLENQGGAGWVKFPLPWKTWISRLIGADHGFAALFVDFFSSPDGEQWTSTVLPTGFGAAAVAGGNGLWVVLGKGGIIASRDGASWETVWSGDCPRVSTGSLAWSGEAFLAVNCGSTLLHSVDGRNWLEREAPPGGELQEVLPWMLPDGRTGFIANRLDGSVWETDSAAIAWQQVENLPPGALHVGAAFAPGVRVVVDRERIVTAICATAGDESLRPPVAGWISVAASSGGYEEGHWSSDLLVSNRGELHTPFEVECASGSDPAAPLRRRAWSIAPGRSGRITDVLREGLGLSGSAPLLFRGEVSLRFDGRLRHETVRGDFVERIPVVHPGADPDSTLAVSLPALPEGRAIRRINAGAASFSNAESSLRLELVSESGTKLASIPLAVPAGGSARLDDLESTISPSAGAVASIRFFVDPPGARLLPWISLIDPQSGDWLFLDPRPATRNQTIPVVTRAAGRNGSVWQTGLALTAPGGPARGSLRLRRTVSDGEVEELAVPFALGAGESRRYVDVVSQILPEPGTVLGNLEIEADEGAVVATAFLHDRLSPGPFGQLVSPVSEPTEVSPGDPLRLVGLSKVAGVTRTNVGVTNLGSGPVEVSIRASFGALAPFASFALTLASGETRHFDPFPGNENVPDATVAIETTAGPARLVAWGSVIEEKSGDPLFVPAQRAR